MPLTRISMIRGKTPEYRKAVAEGVYTAMRETFNVPEEDKFIVIDEYDPDNFFYSSNYLGIVRSGDLMLIQTTVSNTRSIEQKMALFERIVQRLAQDPGVMPEDIFINLVEVVKENWSFGKGLAQYA